jgi:hypothetical protein
MILRRITEHVKAQNWFAVGLDFVIVVFGVFMGLQVSNWNEARAMREDEGRFLRQLHNDIVLTEEISSRLLERRFQRAKDAAGSVDVLFGRSEQRTLTDEQCSAIYSSSLFSLPVASLGSFDELIASGRIGIIRNSSLRADLLALRQISSTTRDIISGFEAKAAPLEKNFPELIEIDAYFSLQHGEVKMQTRCNLEAMRANRGFLNALSSNIDAQDAYIRDGLRRWKEQIEQVHAKVDDILEISHDNEAPK